jgi:hypothetical protein
LTAYIEQTKRPVYMHQDLYDAHLVKVLNFLIEEDLKFTKTLFAVLSAQEKLNEKDKHRISIFQKELSKVNNRGRLKAILSKILQ